MKARLLVALLVGVLVGGIVPLGWRQGITPAQGAGAPQPDVAALRAELDARAAQEAIDERTGRELLLRLRERQLKRDLSGADLARTTELQAQLAKIRQALAELT